MDVLARAIQDNTSNDLKAFLKFMAGFVGLIIVASLLRSLFYSDSYSLINTFATSHSGHWEHFAPMILHFLLLLASTVAWFAAWWQLGDVKGLLIGLLVVLVGSWAVWAFGGMTFMSGDTEVRARDVLPVLAFGGFVRGLGLGFVAISFWPRTYTSQASQMFAYAASLILLFLAFVSVVISV